MTDADELPLDVCVALADPHMGQGKKEVPTRTAPAALSWSLLKGSGHLRFEVVSK
jgi:hypothetical protein